MTPLKILTLVVTGPQSPAVLVLEPIEEQHEGVTRIVPIWIGTNETMQLAVAIEHAKLPRPMTHDLFLDALTNLDTCVDHVVISGVKGQTFFAKLVLRQGGRLIELDARPTDAISLALREDAPFMIDNDVLDASSFPYIFKDEQYKESQIEEFHSFIKDLDPEDFI